MKKFNDRVIEKAMSSTEHGPRLNAIKDQVETITAEYRSVSQEIMALQNEMVIRGANLEKRLGQLKKSGDQLEREWNTIVQAAGR